jgi:hypothetical protein
MGVSERFACRVVGQHRSTQRHMPASDTIEDPDRGLREWLRDYARQHSPCLSGWCDYVVDRVYLDHLLRTELAGRRLVCKLHLDGLDGH